VYKYTLIRVYTKFGGLESHVQCTLIRHNIRYASNIIPRPCEMNE